MRAFEIRGGFGLENLVPTERATLPLNANQIQVKVLAASLNFRDLKMVKGEYNPKQQLPIIPLSDGVGIVTAVGENVKRIRVGDRVVSVFSQEWHDGAPSREFFKSTLGGPLDGMLATEVVLHENGVVRVPDYLTHVEAATLPCAAVTAWNAFTGFSPLRSNDWVVICGTGGVALFGIQFAKRLGAQVIVISSSNDKIERAKSLGADFGINYRNVPEWSKAVQGIVGSEGVDHVLELAGAESLPQSLECTRPGGQVSIIGSVSGALATIDLRKILMKTLRVQGVFVGSRAVSESMMLALEKWKIRPVIDQTFPFEKSQEAFETFATKPHFGKVCISMEESQ